jgi:hypothetical protein
MQPLRLWSSTCLIAAVTVSPDLNLANVSTAASAFQFPGCEPVEIFQAELFTILEKLASGATPLSVEDELEETESLNEDSRANLSPNDETSMAAWVTTRPVFTTLPEYRAALSLNCMGRLEEPAPEEPVREEAAALLESKTPLPSLEEAIGWTDKFTREPSSREDASIHGLPEHGPDGDLAFAAEISDAVVDDASSVAEIPTPRQEDSKREPVGQPLPLAREHRYTRGGKEEQHTVESNGGSASSESSNAGTVAPLKGDSEPMIRPEAKRDATAAVTATALVESLEPIQKTFAVAQQPPRELSMGIVSDQTRVGVQVRESEGTLQISVRTPDTNLSAVLQQNLEDLAATLSKQGMDAQFWTPAEDHRVETRTFENLGDPGQSTPDWQGQGNGSQDGSSQHRQNQRSRFAWLDTFADEQDAEGKDNEVTSWPLTSQTSRARR